MHRSREEMHWRDDETGADTDTHQGGGRRSPLSSLRRKLVVGTLGMTLAVAGAGLALEAPAGATTNDSVGLPPPETGAASNIKKVDVRWGHPLVGRNYVKSVDRKAHILSGMLDVEAMLEGEPEWFYGELALRLTGSRGQISNVVFSLWPFEHTHGNEVTAEIIPPQTIGIEHPLGVPVGRVTFHVKPFEAIANVKEEPKYITGTIRLNGRGPYKIKFVRGNDDAPPPSPLPRAKQVGK